MKKFKQKRKAWYRAFKKLTHIRYKKPEFIFLGDKVKENSIILSNHEGTDSPMSLELYADFYVRFWGTYQMNSGLIKMYKYQSKVYYHQKKHWNLALARLFCLIASPLTNLFYKGLNLISTYPDARFVKTVNESVKAIKEGDNIVIFPERSDEGYTKTIKGFYLGFIVLAEKLLKEGIDANIYTAYFKKDTKQFIFDKPIKYSNLKNMAKDKDELAEILVNNCNTLGENSYLGSDAIKTNDTEKESDEEPKLQM